MKKGQIFLVIILMLLAAPVAIAQEAITLVVNGSVIDTDQPAMMMNGRVMVPVRFVSEALGTEVRWDENSQTVLIASISQETDNHLELADLAGKPGIKILVDGKLVEGDQPPINVNGRIMVPVRFVSEAMGGEVKWIQETGTVVITKDVQPVQSSQADIQMEQPALPTVNFKAFSFSEPYEWPYFLLVPEDWSERWNSFNRTREFTTTDGMVVTIGSGEYASPLVRQPSQYDYLGHAYYTGSKDYEAAYPILMGGTQGYYLRHQVGENVLESYLLKDIYGSFELTFRAKPEVLAQYQDIISLMVTSFQTQRVHEDAGDRVILAAEFINYLLKARAQLDQLPTADKISLDPGLMDQWMNFKTWLLQQETAPLMANLHQLLVELVDKDIAYLQLVANQAEVNEVTTAMQELSLATQSYLEEETRIAMNVFSGYTQGEKPVIGKLAEYRWASGIHPTGQDQLIFSLLVPENWTANREENNLLVTDTSGKYQLNFYVDTANQDLIIPGDSDATLQKYTEYWQNKLQDQEILYAGYGVMSASGGWHIVYQDTFNGQDELVHLFYSHGSGGLIVLQARLPLQPDPVAAELLSIMISSWNEKF